MKNTMKFDPQVSYILQLACGKDAGANKVINITNQFKREFEELAFEVAAEHDLDTPPNIVVGEKNIFPEILVISMENESIGSQAFQSLVHRHIDLSSARKHFDMIKFSRNIICVANSNSDLELISALPLSRSLNKVLVVSDIGRPQKAHAQFDSVVSSKEANWGFIAVEKIVEGFATRELDYFQDQQVSTTLTYSHKYELSEHVLHIVFDKIKEHRPIPIEAKSHPAIRDILEPGQDSLRNIFGYQQETDKIKSLVERLKEATATRQTFTDGVILTGKPGTGKTNLATTIALESGMRTVVCDTAAMLQGDPVELMQSFIDALHAIGPAIVIMEEGEVLLKHREKLSQAIQVASNILLSHLDGPIEDNVPRLWIVTTNFGDAIDSAYRRAGRFSHQIEIPLPCADAREEALKYFTTEFDISLNQEELKLLTIISGSITVKKIEDYLANAKTLCKAQKRSLTLLDIIDQFIPPSGRIKDDGFSPEKEQDRESIAHRIAGEMVLRHTFSPICNHYFASIDHLIYYGDDDLLKPKNYRALERKTMSMLSGRAAEAILRGSDTLSALLNDAQEEELVRYASKATNTVMLSMQTLNDELVQNSQPYKLEMMFIHKMYASVHATLEKNWAEVTSIANTLLEKGYLFNTDIQRHFQKAPMKTEFH